MAAVIPSGITALQVVGLRPGEIAATPDRLYLQSPERYEFFDITDLSKRYVISLITGLYSPFSANSASSAPVTITPTTGIVVGTTLTAVLGVGWTASGYQWKRDDVAISGATAPTYTLVPADATHLITLATSGLVYTPTGVTVSPIVVTGWDDTLTWNDTSTWTD